MLARHQHPPEMVLRHQGPHQEAFAHLFSQPALDVSRAGRGLNQADKTKRKDCERTQNLDESEA
jgi:hypothetical protein